MSGGTDKTGGFTIVETIIVIAVTGLLFVSAIGLLSGQQSKTQFQQSINQITQKIQQTISEVSTGYYPNNNDFSCVASGNKVNLSASSQNSGTNEGCILLGKIIQFSSSGAYSGSPQYTVYSLAGVRQDSTANPPQNVTSLAHAAPVAIAPATNSPTNFPNTAQTSPIPGGLEIASMTCQINNNPCGSTVGAVGFITDLSSSVNGSQVVDLYVVNGTTTGQDSASAVDLINIETNLQAVSSVSICFVSNTTSQSGLVIIGGNGRQLSVVLSIKGNTTCT